MSSTEEPLASVVLVATLRTRVIRVWAKLAAEVVRTQGRLRKRRPSWITGKISAYGGDPCGHAVELAAAFLVRVLVMLDNPVSYNVPEITRAFNRAIELLDGVLPDDFIAEMRL